MGVYSTQIGPLSVGAIPRSQKLDKKIIKITKIKPPNITKCDIKNFINHLFF